MIWEACFQIIQLWQGAIMSKFWDEKFNRDGFTYGTRPNAFLESRSSLLKPGGSVLVPGDGEGRNGVWLAQQGLNVTAVDSSKVGQGKARGLAEDSSVVMQFQLADLLTWDWPTAAFDHVVSIFFHLHTDDRPRLHAAMLAALKPGGILIMEAFRPEQLALSSGGPRVSELLFDKDCLAQDFAVAELLELENASPILDEGPLHQGLAATVRLVARRR